MMLILTESVTLTAQSEMRATRPERAIITLILIQDISALSISMLISTNHPPQLLTLPIRYELSPSQINALHMLSITKRLQALEASGVGESTPELIHTSNTFTSVLQRLVTRIRSFLTSHY